MRVQSYMRQGDGLAPVDIELTLQPGLPQIHFLGLPDAALRESALRIRSAIRSQGFRLPQTQQILVHLRPAHLRKTSRGLDLAVAAALLWETEQIPPPHDSTPIVYGALTLAGEVEISDDAGEIETASLIITGAGAADLPYATWRLAQLRDLAGQPELIPPSLVLDWRRPEPSAKSFPRLAAELAEVVATGEHSLLLAGPPGSGKSTLVETIPAWLEEPRRASPRQLRRWERPGEGAWRPVVRPHHSITPLAMIGGGERLFSGEITRAHGGVLILDELLEFQGEIQEGLREPMETGQITIARGGRVKTYPSRSLVLATTNLCECGYFVPDSRQSDRCRCTRSQRRRSMARLTGPFADRFAILAYSDSWAAERGKGEVLSARVAARVAEAIEFRRRERSQELPNALAPFAELERGLSAFQREHLLGDVVSCGSRRRFESVVRIARTLADLRASSAISYQDLDRAVALGASGHRRLEDWRE